MSENLLVVCKCNFINISEKLVCLITPAPWKCVRAWLEGRTDRGRPWNEVVNWSKNGLQCTVAWAEGCKGDLHEKRAVEGLCEWDKWWCEYMKYKRGHLQREKKMNKLTHNNRQLQLHWRLGGARLLTDSVEPSSVGSQARRQQEIQNPFAINFSDWQRVCWESADVFFCQALPNLGKEALV